MLPQLSPGLQFTLLVAVPSVTALAVGKRLFLPETSLRELGVEFVHSDWKYLGAAWLVTELVNTLAFQFHSPRTFTSVVYAVEGATVATFQAFAAAPLTYFFSGVYLIGFPFLVLFTYFKVKAHSPEAARRYSLAYAVLVVFAAPYFVLFPVKVTSEYLTTVQPLLYELSPVISQGIYSTDTLVKAFPSLHTGLSVLAALYAQEADQDYAYTATALAAAIVFSTLYLGVHWLTDAVFAMILVWIAYRVSWWLPDPAKFVENSRFERERRRGQARR